MSDFTAQEETQTHPREHTLQTETPKLFKHFILWTSGSEPEAICPPGNIWQYLRTVLVVTAGRGEVLLESSRYRSGMLLASALEPRLPGNIPIVEQVGFIIHFSEERTHSFGAKRHSNKMVSERTNRGAWLAESEKRATLDLRVESSKPYVGYRDY